MSAHEPRTGSSREALGIVFGALRRHLVASRGAQDSGEPRLVERVEEAVRRYESEYRGFLAGQRRQPPRELAAALAVVFRELASEPRLRAAAEFRVSVAETRFHAAERLFQRQAERREKGCA
jgi:hypothetical protein